jgi:site-specific DNA-cytosine methylase
MSLRGERYAAEWNVLNRAGRGSPAVRERGAMVGDDGAGAVGKAAGAWIDGTDEDSRDAEGRRALMTPEAVVTAVEMRLFCFRRGKSVKNDSLPRIGRRQFQQFPAPHITDGNVVGEVNRARVAGRDFLGLKTGF